MKFLETPLAGAYLIELEPITDERGFFARSWCQQTFARQGLNSGLVQCNLSFNHRAGTLRGMHFQRPPHAEDKLVRCSQGAIFDVIVDLRKDSPTYRQWYGTELSARNRRQLYIPKGFAHGYQTLHDETEVCYQVTAYYQPDSEGGLRYDEPTLDIRWPLPVSMISDKDQNWEPFVW